mgnify:CR=1 FL=1
MSKTKERLLMFVLGSLLFIFALLSVGCHGIETWEYSDVYYERVEYRHYYPPPRVYYVAPYCPPNHRHRNH